MTNTNDTNTGRSIVSLDTRHRRLSVDFPGWGADDYADHLLPIVAGLVGVVHHVEHHGSNPWTRYTVRFADGTRASGLVEGVDFVFAA